MKHVNTWLKTLVCVVLTAVLISTAAMPALAVSGSSTLASSGSVYVVTARAVNVRAGAGTKYTVVNIVTHGDKVTYLSSYNGWWYVRLSNGSTGYVDKQFFSPVSSTKTGTYTVKANILLLRSKPNTNSSRVAKIKRGTKLYISDLNGDWGYTTYNGKKGWVALKYLTSSSGSTTPTSNTKVRAGSVYTVTASKLNVRHRATTGSSRVDVLTSGTTVRVTQVSGSWAYVTYTKNKRVRQGWVSTSYLS